jgi:chemotaxis protein methyltransferase CheR
VHRGANPGEGGAAGAVEADLHDAIAARTGLAVQGTWHSRLGGILEELNRSAALGIGQPLSAYLVQSGIDTPVWRKILSAVTIGETRFLRQRSWFAQIERLALKPLIAKRRQENFLRLRLWSAGCSTGEEAYTLAMLLRKLLPDADAWDIQIHATDIREEAIEGARRGEYDRRQLRELEEQDVAAFFKRTARSLFSASPVLRRMVSFHVENLVDCARSTAPVRQFDLVLCRNVLMYLKPEAQRDVAAYLAGTLSSQGWLAVSPAEASAEWFKPLVPVNAPEAVLFARQPAPDGKRRSPESPATREPKPTPIPATVAAAPAAAPAARFTLDDLRGLANRGRLAEARERCQSFLAADRLDGAASLLLAEICSELNDTPAAYEAAKRAVYLSPSSSHAHMLLAGALSRLGHNARARKAWTTARRLARAEVKAADDANAGSPDGQGACQT